MKNRLEGDLGIALETFSNYKRIADNYVISLVHTAMGYYEIRIRVIWDMCLGRVSENLRQFSALDPKCKEAKKWTGGQKPVQTWL